MRKTGLFFFLSLGAIAMTAPQCSSSPADCTQTSTCPSDASDGPPPLMCDLTKDPKDSPGCVDDRVGIFVSPTGSDTNVGTKAMPVQTIAKAISLTMTLKRIYICEGTYAEDVSIAPPADGISLYGGFKCADWTYSGNKPQVGMTKVSLSITGTTKAITIEDLFFQAAAGAPNSIAALVSGATGPVTFTRVKLQAGLGAAGTDGTVGSNWTQANQADPSIAGKNASGATGGALQTCTALCTDTMASTGGQGGAGGAAPSSGSGGAPTTNVTSGGGTAGSGSVCSGTGTGGDGGNSTSTGADAVSPAVLGALGASGWTAATAATGKNGGPAQGGGGGAGEVDTTSSGGGGGGGCGGCGGGGGNGGGGGGSSIALAVYSSTVTVNSCELHATDAGNGGKGGAGQTGQLGGYKGNGVGNGCSGGKGGTGGIGGTGAGGVGGISVGVLYKGNMPTLDSATMGATTVGNKGTKGVGGKAGTNDGIDGTAMAVMSSP
jgi:hypothetical protein